jgi:hypothetical protein
MSILNESTTIEECEEALEKKLGELRIVPEGYRPVVELLENGRKKRRTASADSWSPETGEIRISFEPAEPAQEKSLPESVRLNPIKFEFRCKFCGKQTGIKSELKGKNRIIRMLSCGHVELIPITEVRADQAHEVISSEQSATSGSDQALAGLLNALEEAENAPGRMFVALKWFRDEYLPSTGLGWAQNHEERQAVLAKAIQDGWILTGKVHNPKAPLYPTTTIRLNRQKQSGSAPESRFRPVPISGEPLSRTILQDRGSR